MIFNDFLQKEKHPFGCFTCVSNAYSIFLSFSHVLLPFLQTTREEQPRQYPRCLPLSIPPFVFQVCLLVLFPKLFRSLIAKETIYTTIPCRRVFQVFIYKLIKTIFTDVNSSVFHIITASKSKRDMNVVNTFPIFAVTCVFIA